MSAEPALHRFDDGETLAAALADAVAADLRAAIDARGAATLAVSGGSTPKRFLEALSTRRLDWPKVTVTLVDERWVPPQHERSNAALVQAHLLHGAAGSATFLPLYVSAPTPEAGLPRVALALDALPLPLDAVVLGMGGDGHTASFFPGGDRLAEALDPHGRARVLPMRAAGAGEPRITLTLPLLAGARAAYLHIQGEDKRAVLEQARSGADYPIAAVLRQAPRLQTYWCP